MERARRAPPPAGAAFPLVFGQLGERSVCAFAAVRRVPLRCSEDSDPLKSALPGGVSRPPEVEPHAGTGRIPLGWVAAHRLSENSRALFSAHCGPASAQRPQQPPGCSPRPDPTSKAARDQGVLGGEAGGAQVASSIKTARAFAPGLAVGARAPRPRNEAQKPVIGPAATWGFVRSLTPPPPCRLLERELAGKETGGLMEFS